MNFERTPTPPPVHYVRSLDDAEIPALQPHVGDPKLRQPYRFLVVLVVIAMAWSAVGAVAYTAVAAGRWLAHRGDVKAQRVDHVANSAEDYIARSKISNEFSRFLVVTDQPAASSCGDDPLVIGTDVSFRGTVGKGASTCTWTFSRLFMAAPTCTVFTEGAPEPTCSISATAITCPKIVPGATYYWLCTGSTLLNVTNVGSYDTTADSSSTISNDLVVSGNIGTYK